MRCSHGSKLGEADSGTRLAARAAVIRVDILGTQLHKNLDATVGIVGDRGAVAEQLLAALGDSRRPPRQLAGERAADRG